jgi:hypothetical protein
LTERIMADLHKVGEDVIRKSGNGRSKTEDEAA